MCDCVFVFQERNRWFTTVSVWMEAFDFEVASLIGLVDTVAMASRPHVRGL